MSPISGGARRSKEAAMHDWMTWVGQGLPMLILLGFWIYFVAGMKKVGGARWWWKASQRHNELLEQQIEALRQTNELLKKLVAGR